MMTFEFELHQLEEDGKKVLPKKELKGMCIFNTPRIHKIYDELSLLSYSYSSVQIRKANTEGMQEFVQGTSGLDDDPFLYSINLNIQE